jgi:hypothetical protein
MNIPEVRDFDGSFAARELLKQGFTAVDDIGEQLYKHAEAELFDALGHRADSMNIETDRVDTDWGPVFVFRDAGRVSLQAVTAQLRKGRGLAG